MLKAWIKFVLWAAIIVNIIRARQITQIYLEVAEETRVFVAGLATLGILLLLGIIFGSIVFGGSVLMLGKDEIIHKKPTNEYCIRR